MKRIDKYLAMGKRLIQTIEDWPGVLVLSPEEAAKYTGRQHVIIDDVPDCELEVLPCRDG